MERLESPGRTAARYSRIGSPILRQLSTIEKIAATLGPASLLPRWIQLRRPMAIGRLELSARLLLSSNSGYSRKSVSFFHSVRVYRGSGHIQPKTFVNAIANEQILITSGL